MESLQSEQSVRPDGELLRRYLDSRDDVALTELITRHAALVRGVCRRVLGNTPDADDAFQATFLVLVRSGGRILRPQSLAAWLFGVAHRISKRQRRQRGLPAQSVREDQVMIEHDPLAELATRHDISLFDAELARLPEKYRAPIVLHHLEGKTQREVAAELQLTEGAVDGLLKRGRNELRLRLARKGVVFGITLAAVQTAQNAVAALPPQSLIETTVQGMLLHDPVLHADPINTPVARLAHQEMSTMALFQVTKITAWTLVGSLFLGAAGVGVSTARHNSGTNQAGVIVSKLASAQAELEPPAIVGADDSQKPTDGTNDVADKAGDSDAVGGGGDGVRFGGDAAAQPPAALREGKLSDDPVMKKLDEETEISFVETSFQDALSYLSMQHGFNIYIDEQTIQQEIPNANWQINLELSGVKLRSALKLLLEPLGLDYIIADEVMKITTKRAAENFYEMRMYRDHPWSGQMDGSRLQALIKDSVGGRWKPPGSDGSGGTIQVTPAGVAVRQNQRTLLAIEKLLAQLEQRDDAKQPLARIMPGTIRQVDRDTKSVWINLGTADNVKPRMSINIHGQVPDGTGTKQRHGIIEITRVLGERLAEGRIIEEDLTHPIAVGDSGEPPTKAAATEQPGAPKKSHAGERIAIVGDVDLDGDGKSDREMFHKLLKGTGIEITNEVNDAGERKGEKIGEDTKFLVLGDIPNVVGGRNPERERMRKVMEHLKELRKEAKSSGIRIVSLNDFLDYIGQPKANPVPDPEKPRPMDFRERNPIEARIGSALREQTEISFVETSLKVALEYVEDLHNIDILIKETEITGDGGSADQQVNLELSGVTLESALDLMLEPLGLDYVIKNEVLLITTTTKAAEQRELRVYNLYDFKSMFGEIKFDEEAATQRIAKAIQKAVAGEWETEKGGDGGTMSLTPAGLVVRQNQRTHREIENLIEQLRRAEEAK